jgi:DNA polymerase-3 subunit chi
MPEVDFYVVKEGARTSGLGALCQLVVQLWGGKQSVYIHADSADQAQRLDEMLWTYQDIGFVPHTLAGDPLASATPVVIGHAAEPAAVSDVLLNLAHPAPAFGDRFARVAEFVDSDADKRRLSRERFRAYRDRGLNVNTITL